jgi:two-component system, chemotaxis family, chemotaxis protein CheY
MGRILIVSGEDEAVLRATQAKAEALDLNVPYVLQKPLDFQKLRAMLMHDQVVSAA